MLAPLCLPGVVWVTARKLRREGIPVGSIKDVSERSNEQNLRLAEVARGAGVDAVLLGRCVAVGVLTVGFAHFFMPAMAWWIEFLPIVALFFIANDRLRYPLIGLAIQLVTKVALG